MPPHIQTVLSASSEPLDKLAIIADKVSEVVGSSSTICAATTVPPPSQSSSCSVQPTLDSLARQIQELSLQVAELTRERNSSRHQRYSSDRRRLHSRSRVSIEEVASATIIAVIKSRPANRKSGQKFLIDSGSEICVIPPSPTMNKSPQSNFSLFAANNTKIPAYGMVRKELNLGLRRPFIWTFIIADVSSPIIGIIRPSKSPWSSPLHVVPKSDSTVRPVGDYRQLNSVTEFDSYPMPYLNDFAHALHGKKIFSKIDIFKAFHQIPIAEGVNKLFADPALLAHPSPSAPLALHVDASDYAIGGALHQVVDSELQPLAFFSRKLTSSEKSYSAYDRELLAIYSAIRHFRYMLEARDFTVFTDHKPLTYAFRQKSDKCSPRQIRQAGFHLSVHHKYCTHSRI
ncbi:uncharacterized protein TNCV_2001711 [Trichonephila clavipes]|nr:uncharacterized protein TNCV_2001711 [Trichonephila clavipes]